MKASEIRDLSFEERQRKGDDLKEELLSLRFQNKIGQIENPQKLKQVRRDIARVKTIINEFADNKRIDNK